MEMRPFYWIEKQYHKRSFLTKLTNAFEAIPSRMPKESGWWENWKIE